MPTTSPRIPSTSCCWGGTRSPAIFFNGFYDTWCYLPLLAFVTFGREAEQYLCAAVLRSGKAVASEGAVALLSGFAAGAAAVRVSAGAVPCSARRGLCDTGGLRLPGCRPAARLRHLDTEERARTARSSRTEHVYGETRYAAGSWKQQRRVVIKAEVVRLAGREPRDNPRFVVTNLGRPPRSLYEKVSMARAVTSRTGSRSCSTGCRSARRDRFAKAMEVLRRGSSGDMDVVEQVDGHPG